MSAGRLDDKLFFFSPGVLHNANCSHAEVVFNWFYAISGYPFNYFQKPDQNIYEGSELINVGHKRYSLVCDGILEQYSSLFHPMFINETIDDGKSSQKIRAIEIIGSFMANIAVPCVRQKTCVLSMVKWGMVSLFYDELVG